MKSPEEQIRDTNNEPDLSKENPVGFSILLVFSFVYNGILFLLMLIGLIYPGVIKDILLRYFPTSTLQVSTAFILTLGGTLVFADSLVGLFFLTMRRKLGFYLFASGQLIMLATLVFVLKSYDLINISIALVIVIIFGLYSRSMK